MTRLEILSTAEEEIFTSATSYEMARTGLGERFIQVVDRRIKVLQTYPQLGPVVQPITPIRRLLTLQFPYGIFYTYDPETDLVLVSGVVQLEQDPEALRRRFR